MSTIIVRDLALSQELDRSSLATIRGGTSWLGRVGSAGPLANVNININQNIAQLQEINVATLNGQRDRQGPRPCQCRRQSVAMGRQLGGGLTGVLRRSRLAGDGTARLY